MFAVSRLSALPNGGRSLPKRLGGFPHLTRRKSRFPVLTPAARLGGPRLALEHLAGGAVTTIPRGSFDDHQLMRPGVARSARA